MSPLLTLLFALALLGKNYSDTREMVKTLFRTERQERETELNSEYGEDG